MENKESVLTEKKYKWQFHPVYILAIIFCLHLCTAIDNDTWWLLAMGRNILENGIPFYEPLTIHSGLEFVPQQWLTSVIFQSVFASFGGIGMAVLVTGCMLCVNLLLYNLCSKISGKSQAALWTSAIATLFLSVMFGTGRPQIFTYIIMLSEITMLWAYSKSGNWKHLIALPLLSVLQINLHASMWFMLFVFAAPLLAEYLAGAIDKWLGRKGKNILGVKTRLISRDFPLTPLLIALGAMVIAGFANPYGLKMMLYLKNSFGVESIDSFVNEMKPTSWSNNKIILVLTLLSIAVICASKKKLPISYLCYFAGTTILMLRSLKGVAYFLICAAPVVAYAASEWKLNFKPKKQILGPQYRALIWMIVLPYSLFMLCSTLPGANDLSQYKSYGAAEVVTWVEGRYDIRKSDRVYAGYNTGGYLEFKGYRPYIDARAEIFLKANNAKEDIFDEFIGLTPKNAGEFLGKYDFEYVFAEPGSALSAYMSLAPEEAGYTCIKESTPSDKGQTDLEIWIRNDLLASRKKPKIVEWRVLL